MSSMAIDEKRYLVHPYKFNVWLFIMSIIMIFGGLTSAYMVDIAMKPDDRLFFRIPSILWTNLATILVSSITIQYAAWAERKGDIPKALVGLGLTLFLGLIFLWGQVKAWGIMTEGGLPFVDSSRRDNSASFFYILTGLHGLHVVGTLFVLIYTFIKTGLNNFKNGKESRRITFEVTITFWHFLSLLWVFLLVVIWMTQNSYI
ncbi:MAG: cytochrome c oxidase subunit 3 [Bacteroidota bacterium]